MGFNLTKIMNEVLDVRVTNALDEKTNIGKERFIIERYGVLEANSGQVVLFENIEDQIVLDYLEFSTNSLENIRLRIFNGNTQAMVSMTTNGAGRLGFTAKDIDFSVNGMFDVLEFNTSSNVYKFRLNLKELKLPYGMRVSIENTASTDYNCAVYAFGRVL